jgi:predicted PurR-regulated permease PerM
MKKKRNKTVQDEEPVDAGTFSFERFYHENRRVLIWIILGAVLWLLRSFFSLIFLTFVFAFVAAPISEFFVRRFRMRRRLAICVAFGTLVALLSSMTVFVAPQVTREAANLVGNLPKTEERLLELRRDIIARYPTIEPILMNYLRSSIPDDLLADLTLKMEKDRSSLSAAEAPPRDPGVNLAPTPAQAEMGPGEREMMRAAREDEAVIHLFLKYQIEKLTDAAPRMIGSMWAASATILLALLFSFLISLDTLRLRQEIRNLRNSRLRHFYEETALPVVRFGYVVG